MGSFVPLILLICSADSSVFHLPTCPLLKKVDLRFWFSLNPFFISLSFSFSKRPAEKRKSCAGRETPTCFHRSIGCRISRSSSALHRARAAMSRRSMARSSRIRPRKRPPLCADSLPRSRPRRAARTPCARRRPGP